MAGCSFIYPQAITDRRQPLDKRAELVLHAKWGRIMLAASLELRLDDEKLMRVLRRVEKGTDGAVEAFDLAGPTGQSPRHPAPQAGTGD